MVGQGPPARLDLGRQRSKVRLWPSRVWFPHTPAVTPHTGPLPSLPAHTCGHAPSESSESPQRD